MGLIGSIIVSVIVLVIAIVIVQIIFNPFYLNGLERSFSNAISGVVNSAQTATIKATVATQSNKPILYIAENDNNTIALLDIQYNKIISFINLDGASPTNLGLGANNQLAVAESYYNYHSPQYHGMVSIVNTSNDKVIGTISMAAVPTQIAVSTNGTYAYTINNNNSESSINLQSMVVTGSFPFTTQYQNVTGTPEGLIFSPTQNILYVLVNYGNCADEPFTFSGECSDETLFALNGSNINQTIWSIQLTPDNIYSSGPKQLAMSPNGETLYAIIGDDEGAVTTIAVINTTSQKELKTITFGFTDEGGTSLSISPAGDYLYAIDGGVSDDIAVINTSSETVVDSKSIGYLVNSPTQLTDVAVSSNFTYVMDSSIGSYGLITINRNNDSITQNIGIDGCPCEIVPS